MFGHFALFPVVSGSDWKVHERTGRTSVSHSVSMETEDKMSPWKLRTRLYWDGRDGAEIHQRSRDVLGDG